MTPQLQVIPNPQRIKLLEENITRHLDLATGGVFTEQQLQKWELANSFPDYHQAMGRRVAKQACAEERCDISHVQTMGQLKGIVEQSMEILDWRENIKGWVQWIGQVTSIIVVAVWTVQIISRVVLCGQIFRTDGISPAWNLCQLFFTKDKLLVREYHEMKKTQQREAGEPMMDMVAWA